MSDLAKKYGNFLAPEAVVWINGKKLSQSGLSFSELKVDMVLEGADTFSLTLSDSFDPEELKPKKASLFSFGDVVEIHFGYADNRESKNSLSTIFKGVVTSIRWNFSEENFLEVTVDGKDFSFLMMKHRYKRSGGEAVWNEKSDADAVKEVFDSTYKSLFKKSIIESEHLPVKKQIRHKEDNDFAFFTEMAKRNGYEFFVQKDIFFFRMPPKSSKGEVTLKYGREILSFTPEFNVDKQVAKVRVIGVELGPDKKKISAEAPESNEDYAKAGKSALKELLKNLNNIEYEMRVPVESVEAAKRLAESKYQELSAGLMKAQLKSVGVPELKPGSYISLEGVGKRFSRAYYVTKAVHSFGGGGYETELELKNDGFILGEGGK